MKKNLTLICVFLVNTLAFSQPALEVTRAAISNNPESIAVFNISDSPSDYLETGNATGVNNQFIPVIRGHVESDSRNALFLSASTIGINDISSSIPLMTFNCQLRPSSGNGSAITNRLLFGWSNFTDIQMVLSANGSLGIGTINPSGKLDVMGDIYQNGSLIHSDKRFKKNIQPIKNALEVIKKLNGVSYDMRTKEFESRSFSENRQIGLIAQDIEKVVPSLVSTKTDGYKAVNYDGVIPILIEGIKEQQETIEQQQSQIDELKELVNALIETKKNNIQTTVIQSVRLGQNMPNPFNKSTRISYNIPPDSKKAFIQLFNINGQLLKNIPIDTFGEGIIELQTQGLSNGQYTYTLEVDGRIIETKKMNLIK